MKGKMMQMASVAGGLKAHHIRLILVILSLAMFVIGAGAPADGSGWGG